MSNPKPSGVVTGAEAARIKGISRQAIYAAIKDGRLPARQVGRVRLISRVDLDKWLPAHQRPKENKEKETMTELEERIRGMHEHLADVSRRVHAVLDRNGGEITLRDLAEALADEEEFTIDGTPNDVFSDMLYVGGGIIVGLTEALLHPVDKDGPFYAVPVRSRDGDEVWKRADLCDHYEVIAFLIGMRGTTGMAQPSMDRFLDAMGARLPQHDAEFRFLVHQFRDEEQERDAAWRREMETRVRQ